MFPESFGVDPGGATATSPRFRRLLRLPGSFLESRPRRNEAQQWCFLFRRRQAAGRVATTASSAFRHVVLPGLAGLEKSSTEHSGLPAAGVDITR